MKNRKPSRDYEARRRKLKKLLEDPETSEEELMNETSEKDFMLMHEITRENQLNELFMNLNINQNKLEKVRRKVIKIRPKSKKYHLVSHIFRKHKGLYLVDSLFNEYYDDILINGVMVGVEYGKKFIVDDIQNNRITKEDLMNMNEDELYEYFYESRKEI